MRLAILTECKSKLRVDKINLEKEIEAVNESINSDTKSSAGDKYETGREMMNQERGKLQAQLAIVNRNLEILNQLKETKQHTKVEFGAMVKTSLTNYFISISYGKVQSEEGDVFLISGATPLAQLMMGKKAGDKVNWNGKDIIIQEVI